MIVLRLLAALVALVVFVCAAVAVVLLRPSAATDPIITPLHATALSVPGHQPLGVTARSCTMLRDESGHHATVCPEPGAAGAAHVWGREGRP